MMSHARDRLYGSTFISALAIGHSAVMHEGMGMKRTSGGKK
jgi:hypothetical protein